MNAQEPKNQVATAAAPAVTISSVATGPLPALQPAPHPTPSTPNGPLPVVLLILDGWGVALPSRGNAISLAQTPNMDRLMQQYPTVTLHASGELVGLPWAEMGNSEVGHLNIGAGRIIYQHLPLINKAIADGTFFSNPELLTAITTVKERNTRLHLLGLTSDGGIHSSIDHLFALLELCRNNQMTKDNVVIHALLDGRDTERNAALGHIAKLEMKMQETGVGRIATIGGRYWAMDRDNHWDRIEAAYNAIHHGTSEHTSDSPLKAIEVNYGHGVFDEEIPPTVITDKDGAPVATVNDGDVIIFFNFRADRARQITKAFVLPAFQKFNRGTELNNLNFITMTEYEQNLPVRIAFPPDHVRTPVAAVVADAGWKQLHVAETEKYAHVTFFFNGGNEEQHPNEDRELIPSPRVTSYAQTPEMAVNAVAQKIINAVSSRQHRFIVANFANPDMVGHTGDLPATIKAIEATDAAIGAVASAVEAVGATLVVTADHGNAEQMLNLQTGEVNKEHTTNPVPCIIVNELLKANRAAWPQVVGGDLSRLQPVGVLSDVAPTVLTLMGLPIPPEMTSRSLIR